MSKFYAYGRHSTAKQGITEEVQRERLTLYWKSFLEPQGVEWGGWFYDAATSAGQPLTERPKGREVWALAQPGDHVGFAKLDRAFRRMMDGVLTMHMFQSKKVGLHILDVRIDTSTAMGQCIAGVLLAFAQLERDLASERTRDALAMKRQRGEVHLCAPPIGWKYVGRKTKTMVVNQEERDKVARWYAEYQAGMTLEKLYLRIFKEGHKRGGRGWHIRTISRAFNAMLQGFPAKKVSDTRFIPRGSRLGHVVRSIG